MVQHSFDVGLGVFQFAPDPNVKKKSKEEFQADLIRNLAKNNGISEAEAWEYSGLTKVQEVG